MGRDLLVIPCVSDLFIIEVEFAANPTCRRYLYTISNIKILIEQFKSKTAKKKVTIPNFLVYKLTAVYLL